MLKNRMFRVLSIMLVLVSVFAFTMPASAAGESVSIDSFNTTVCTPGSYITGAVTHVNGSSAVGIEFALTNNTKGTADVFSAGILPSGTYIFGMFVPASTESGDSMTMSIVLLDSGSSVVGSAALAYSCGTAAGTGLDMFTLPDGAVVGQFVANTAIMQSPGVEVSPAVVMEAGKTLWVLGVDETGMYYKVALSGQFFWVPVGSMGPNYDEVWNGTPLPTTTVY